MKKKLISFYIEPDDYMYLRKSAKRQDKTFSEFLRMLIKIYIAKEKEAMMKRR